MCSTPMTRPASRSSVIAAAVSDTFAVSAPRIRIALGPCRTLSPRCRRSLPRLATAARRSLAGLPAAANARPSARSLAASSRVQAQIPPLRPPIRPLVVQTVGRPRRELLNRTEKVKKKAIWYQSESICEPSESRVHLPPLSRVRYRSSSTTTHSSWADGGEHGRQAREEPPVEDEPRRLTAVAAAIAAVGIALLICSARKSTYRAGRPQSRGARAFRKALGWGMGSGCRTRVRVVRQARRARFKLCGRGRCRLTFCSAKTYPLVPIVASAGHWSVFTTICEGARDESEHSSRACGR